MNLLPNHKKHKKLLEAQKRKPMDGAVLMHSEARVLKLKVVQKPTWQNVFRDRLAKWRKQRRSRPLTNRPALDGVRVEAQSRQTWSQKFAHVRRVLLHGQWRPVSVVGAFLLGVFLTGSIYRSLQASFAAESSPSAQVAGVATSNDVPSVIPQTVADEQFLTDEDIANFTSLIADSQEKQVFEKRVREMVKGYPIEAMLPYILEQDHIVAAFLVSIGKKESNWGKRVPVLDGQDCFNYWGYRGIRERMGTGGHTCFENRQDAVNTVAKRIKTLVEKNQLNTPQKMIIWKCGNTCSGHSRESVVKWISDVEMYFSRINQKEDAS